MLIEAPPQPASYQTPSIVAIGPSAYVAYSTAFLTSGAPPWLDVVWRTKLDSETVRTSIPFKSGQFAMVNLRCAGFMVDGHLSHCSILAEPAGVGYEAAAERLLQGLVADKAFVASIAGKVQFVTINLHLSNSDVKTAQGPCWPPSCLVERAGPPPPPPPPVEPNPRS